MGCPIILSDRCGSYGNHDDVQEDKNGYVFPFGDINALATAIKKLSTNKGLRDKMSEYSNLVAIGFQERSHNTVLNDLIPRLI
jgi:glycosyltransferase involved in cell wall biosynthesis